MTAPVNAALVNMKRAAGTQGPGNFDTLKDLADAREIEETAIIYSLTGVNGQHALIDNSIVSGNIAIGINSQIDNGGIMAAALVGAIDNAATTNFTDDYGNICNKVQIVDADSHDPLLDGDGRTIYGLIQCASTVTDGDAIGAAASENLQISFVSEDSSEALQLVSVTGNINISIGKLVAMRHRPKTYKKAGPAKSDVIAPVTDVGEPTVRKYEVTTGFDGNEVINISTGAGSNIGACTVTGDTISSIGINATVFNEENRTRIHVVGPGQLTKGVYVIWDSETALHFTFPLYVGDRFEIEVA